MKICDLGCYEEHNVGEKLKAVVCPTYDTEFLLFDNETGCISKDDALFIYGGRS